MGVRAGGGARVCTHRLCNVWSRSCDATHLLCGERHCEECVDELSECDLALPEEVAAREEGDGVGGLEDHTLKALPEGNHQDGAAGLAVDLSKSAAVALCGARLKAKGGDGAGGGDALREQLGSVLQLFVAELLDAWREVGGWGVGGKGVGGQGAGG